MPALHRFIASLTPSFAVKLNTVGQWAGGCRSYQVMASWLSDHAEKARRVAAFRSSHVTPDAYAGLCSRIVGRMASQKLGSKPQESPLPKPRGVGRSSGEGVCHT